MIAVVGAGVLGTKIAGALAYHGHRVRIYDTNPAALKVVHERLQQDKRELQQSKILNKPTFVGEVVCCTYLHEAVGNAEFVFETVAENLEIKQDVFERISNTCLDDCIIATSTLQLDVTQIAARVRLKERTIGVRFLYPVYCIPEVEVTPNQFTTMITLNRVHKFLERIGRTIYFRSGPTPFILNQVQQDTRIEEYRRCLDSYQTLRGRSKHLPPELFHMKSLVPLFDGNTVSPSDVERECAICLNNPRGCVLLPCRHLCTCGDCGMLLSQRKDTCPICRTKIVEVLPIFHS